MNKKNCLFQYATQQRIIEDTDLITFEEALGLWDKYLPDVKAKWNEYSSPEICIWMDCNSNTDYTDDLYHIDFSNCELQGGRFYRVTKKIITLPGLEEEK